MVCECLGYGIIFILVSFSMVESDKEIAIAEQEGTGANLPRSKVDA